MLLFKNVFFTSSPPILPVKEEQFRCDLHVLCVVLLGMQWPLQLPKLF